MPVFPGRIDPDIDVQGYSPIDNTRTLTDETNQFGTEIDTGTGDSFAFSSPTVTLTDAGASFTSDMVGSEITIVGATSGGNNGSFIITDVPSGTTIDFYNTAGVAEAFAGTWTIREHFSIADHVEFTATDRRLIKGTASHTDAIPTYERPTAVGTAVDKNLTNLLSVDGYATVADVVGEDTKLRPSIAQTGTGNVLISDETFTTDDFHFTADDLDSFVTLTDNTATGATGTYRIKTVTDGQTLELDGLAATGAGTVDWVLEGDLKGVLTSASYADAVDRTGVPIADSGAEDETEYDATFVEVVNPVVNGSPSEEDGDRIFARSFGDEKDPNNTVTNEGTRFFVQLLTGANTGAAVDSLLEPISGKSGSAASVTDSTTVITGLIGSSTQTGTGDDISGPDASDKATITDAGATFTGADVGRIIVISGASNGANNGTFLITDFIDANNIKIANSAAIAETSAFSWDIRNRLVTEQDIGNYITIYGTAVDGNQRHALITAFAEGQVTVDGANFATDGNDGAILWQISRHPGNWDFYYGQRFRNDQLSETWARRTLVSGLQSDAELVMDIAEIREYIGAADGDTSPALTNTGNYYAWSTVPDTGDTSLEELVNILNREIGDRDYSASALANVPGLADGQSISDSIEQMAIAIGSASITRVIERLSADVDSNTAHTIPGGNTYTLDGTDNGLYLWVYWRKQLRDPGAIDDTANDYEETSTTQITPWQKIKAGDHINYFILQ